MKIQWAKFQIAWIAKIALIKEYKFSTIIKIIANYSWITMCILSKNPQYLQILINKIKKNNKKLQYWKNKNLH